MNLDAVELGMLDTELLEPTGGGHQKGRVPGRGLQDALIGGPHGPLCEIVGDLGRGEERTARFAGFGRIAVGRPALSVTPLLCDTAPTSR